MTNREFYTAIVNSDLNDEMKAFATEAIEKLDARNAKRANTLSKTQKETTFPSTFQMKIYDESWSAQKPCEEVFGND